MLYRLALLALLATLAACGTPTFDATKPTAPHAFRPVLDAASAVLLADYPLPWGVVPGPFAVETVRAAVEEWNRALGLEALYVDAGAPSGLGGHVYLSEGECLDAPGEAVAGCQRDAPGQVFYVELLPGEIRAQNTLRHELGHVLGGATHSDSGLMAEVEWSPRYAPISTEDAARTVAHLAVIDALPSTEK